MTTDLLGALRRGPFMRATTMSVVALVGALTTLSVAASESSGRTVAQPIKVKTCSNAYNGTGCLAAKNTSSGNAVYGLNTGTGYGVMGETDNSTGGGVAGYSYGSPGSPGVYGYSYAGFGVSGYSYSGYGVLAQSSGADGVSVALGVYNPDAAPQVLIDGETGAGAVFQVYGTGNVAITGEMYTEGSCHEGCSRTRHVGSFAQRSSQPTIEDFGEATLRDGGAHVALDPSFANVVDATHPFLVSLTPEGDASLYVAGRTSRGFDVRQVGGGHASIAFSYRIVAKPYGVKDERLPARTDAPARTFPRHPTAR
jgi:hypothetical protein